MYKLKPIEWTSIEVYKDDDADQYWVPQGDVPIHIKRVNGVYIIVKYWCDCDVEPYDNFEEAAAAANREIESELTPYLEYVSTDTSEISVLRAATGRMQKELDAKDAEIDRLREEIGEYAARSIQNKLTRITQMSR